MRYLSACSSHANAREDSRRGECCEAEPEERVGGLRLAASSRLVARPCTVRDRVVSNVALRIVVSFRLIGWPPTALCVVLTVSLQLWTPSFAASATAAQNQKMVLRASSARGMAP